MNNPTNQTPEESPSRPWAEAWRDVAPHLDLGWRLVGATALPPFAGWFIDSALGTAPWITILGVVLGLGAAVHVLVTLYHTP